MKAHELAKQLLAGPDQEVWIEDPLYEDEPTVVVGIFASRGDVVTLETEEYTTPEQAKREAEAAAKRIKKVKE